MTDGGGNERNGHISNIMNSLWGNNGNDDTLFDTFKLVSLFFIVRSRDACLSVDKKAEDNRIFHLIVTRRLLLRTSKRTNFK